jgi:ElaB/YqjD/DUF883 family membrane-anchored ribosome-binding protein
MIPLAFLPPPVELTDELVTKLTQHFRQTEESVWQRPFIKKALLAMSHSKCAYCECLLIEEGKYLEVEHFLAKKLFPMYVLLWENLLPACGRCNRKKSTHDAMHDPIIHPVYDLPNDHLKLNGCYFKKKTTFGKRTIEVLDLNNDAVLLPRQRVAKAVKDLFDQLEDLLEDFGENAKPRVADKIVNRFQNLLAMARPEKAYSATIATTIAEDSAYFLIKQFVQSQNRWDNEFQNLENTVFLNAFETK